ncbi:unnamed protein product [Lupinus luteus]|uniref:Uncharacterized protein n=1 Tax=Lupinus luteus TaxID=3873 RepID=A0AAV1XJL9_LUPLU
MVTEELDARNCLVFGGDGGEGRSSIPKSLLIAHFDVTSNSLSDQPYGNGGIGSGFGLDIVVVVAAMLCNVD